MSPIERLEEILSLEGVAIFIEPRNVFDAAIVGTGCVFGASTVIVYDRRKCVLQIAREMGMKPTEAREYFAFNVEGAYVGKGTPIFMERLADH